MTRIEGAPVLTAAQMRAAEERAVAAGVGLDALMARAGEGVAAAVRRLAAGAEVLILCGPGNNGGDGWVAAASLARNGHPVRVAAPLGDPRTDLARAARAAWTGPVESVGLGTTQSVEHGGSRPPIVVDALFGIGLTRAPEEMPLAVRGVIHDARLSIAVDLPSGLASDTGEVLGPTAPVDITVALGFLKPAHLLQPGAELCGAVRVIDIGVDATSDAGVLAAPRLAKPGPSDHKYTRGMVAVVAGEMAGASLLAATAAMRAGAGYVALLGGAGQGGPHALVYRPLDEHSLSDPRIGALLIGPGLGRDDAARAKLARALATDHPLVIDGDALGTVDLDHLAARAAPAILTPHAGEFRAAFGELPGSKLDQARAAAVRSSAVVVFKGADTVIAAPDGRARLSPGASPWLSTAGTGDVLAGAVAAMLAARLDPLEAAAAGVWLHTEAARRCGAAFIADDLAAALTPARADL